MSILSSTNSGKHQIAQKYEKYGLDFSRVSFNADGTIDYDGDISINYTDIKALPFKFGVVNGSFNVSGNALTTLEGCPHTVNGGFFCTNNALRTLAGGPKVVKREYVCAYNYLTSLDGCAYEVGGDFECDHNSIDDISAVPTRVDGVFICSHNRLTSLKSSCVHAGKGFDASYNIVTAIDYLPAMGSGAYVNLSFNAITSLRGLPECCDGSIDVRGNSIKSFDGSPKVINGDFLCGNNDITCLDGMPEQVSGRLDLIYNKISKVETNSVVTCGSAYVCNNRSLLAFSQKDWFKAIKATKLVFDLRPGFTVTARYQDCLEDTPHVYAGLPLTDEEMTVADKLFNIQDVKTSLAPSLASLDAFKPPRW